MNKKRLKMDADVYVEKSFEEVLEDFIPLKRRYIKSLCSDYQVDNGYDKDDIDSICNMYIWKAYEKYNNIEVSFPYYLSMTVQHGMNTEMRKFRRTDNRHASMDKRCVASKHSEPITMHDTIAGTKNQEYIAVNLLYIEKVVEDSIEKHQTIFNEHFKLDLNCREIADKHGMKPVQVSKILYQMKGKMKN